MMPHVVYLHSALTSRRIRSTDSGHRRSLLRFERWDVVVALGTAGLVNLSMLLVAAKVFHGSPGTGDGLDGGHRDLGTMVGGGAALAFAVALLASGISSSSVGTYAGQVVMAGFSRLRILLLLRRAVTMVPALLVLASGIDATQVLTSGQVVLSFGIPFALIPLVLVTRDRNVMASFANPRWLDRPDVDDDGIRYAPEPRPRRRPRPRRTRRDAAVALHRHDALPPRAWRKPYERCRSMAGGPVVLPDAQGVEQGCHVQADDLLRVGVQPEATLTTGRLPSEIVGYSPS